MMSTKQNNLSFTSRPKVSFVGALRNADKSGGLLHRASVFLRNVVELSNQVGLDSELVLVEWNPLPNVKRVRECLNLPKTLGRVSVRLIVVPAETHQSFFGADTVPFFESIAKNVGLRRSYGTFRVITNPDIVFTPEVFHFLANGPLDPEVLYRLDRYEIGHDLTIEASVEEQLAFCKRNVVGLHALYATLTFDEPQNADLLGGSHIRLRELLNEYEGIRSDSSYKSPLESQLIFPVDGIHTNASGCFLLMHVAAWHKIRGNAEFTTREHDDSVTCWSALSAGVKQSILKPPCRLFHQPHGRSISSNWPTTDWHPWHKRFLEAIKQGNPLLVNDAQWGLADLQFEEWQASGDSNGQWRRKTVAGGIESVSRAAA